MAVEDRRVDEGGVHRVGADVVARLGAVQRHRFAEQPNARLGRIVGRHVGAGDDARDRRDVDDRAAQRLRVFLDFGHAVLAAQEHAVEVDGVDAAPFLQRDVLDRLGEADAGRIHQHVQRAEGLHRLGDGGLPIFLAGDVEPHEMGGLADLGGERTALVLLDVGDHDAGALLGHQYRAALAETRRAAGDEGHLAGQTIGHFFFPPAAAPTRDSRWAM